MKFSHLQPWEQFVGHLLDFSMKFCLANRLLSEFSKTQASLTQQRPDPHVPVQFPEMLTGSTSAAGTRLRTRSHPASPVTLWRTDFGSEATATRWSLAARPLKRELSTIKMQMASSASPPRPFPYPTNLPARAPLTPSSRSATVLMVVQAPSGTSGITVPKTPSRSHLVEWGQV